LVGLGGAFVKVLVGSGVSVNVAVEVGVAVSVAVEVAVAVEVNVAVEVEVAVAVAVWVAVLVAVWVAVGVSDVMILLIVLDNSQAEPKTTITTNKATSTNFFINETNSYFLIRQVRAALSA